MESMMIDSGYIHDSQESIEMNTAIQSAQTLVSYCERFADEKCQDCTFDTARGCAVHMPFTWHSNFLIHKNKR